VLHGGLYFFYFNWETFVTESFKAPGFQNNCKMHNSVWNHVVINESNAVIKTFYTLMQYLI